MAFVRIDDIIRDTLKKEAKKRKILFSGYLDAILESYMVENGLSK